MAKKTSYKGKELKDLVKTLSEKKDALQKFQFAAAGGKVRNVKEGGNLKKEIARIRTEMNAQAKGGKLAKNSN